MQDVIAVKNDRPAIEDLAALRRTPPYKRVVRLLRSSAVVVLGGLAAGIAALAAGWPSGQIPVIGAVTLGVLLALFAGIARRSLARRFVPVGADSDPRRRVQREVALNEALFADVLFRGGKP